MAPIAGRVHQSGRDGAIAQLGERIVRNDEVGGSIPPGSTSLCSLRELRLGKPAELFRSDASEGCLAIARRATAGFHRKSYFPVNRGGRFSMKLATPSLKSLPFSATIISRLASMVASASVWKGTS